ncbi:hypothetical protein OGAPHI_005834 [Ogataea philodendri]|uniref:Protein KTI12 n=1 Tax=Ogataea philodendri TaxID=1378263 RepID=A0A9P8NZS6_9ASCO|nr:uncharacterized protein OGAPHI_005834 [Ogataea philodendri]KAH3662582.1 hypothetical protein OGAPHI_005834 [Ogataea philodendri]
MLLELVMLGSITPGVSWIYISGSLLSLISSETARVVPPRRSTRATSLRFPFLVSISFRRSLFTNVDFPTLGIPATKIFIPNGGSGSISLHLALMSLTTLSKWSSRLLSKSPQVSFLTFHLSKIWRDRIDCRVLVYNTIFGFPRRTFSSRAEKTCTIVGEEKIRKNQKKSKKNTISSVLMPLIVFAGYPSSGKTTRATELKRLFEEKIRSLPKGEPGSNLKVVLHNDESLGISHNAYRESVTEKAARSAQISAVKRDISRSTVVILDSLAYIKGFRYQLHCESKALSTPHCVIQVITPLQTCLEWNSGRPEAEKWDEQVMKELVLRYEEPDGQNKWDSPLIPIGFDDPELPFEDIWADIALKKGPRPNQSTVTKPAIEINYLQQLDRLTASVVQEVSQFQEINGVGHEIRLSVEGGECVVEMPTREVSIAQLQRFRRAFVGLNRMRNVGVERIGPLFGEYLSRALNQ